MSDPTPSEYKHGDAVWVKLGKRWWPGEIIDFEQLDPSIKEDLQSSSRVRLPFAIVKFFQEDSYEYVKKPDQIFPYNCSKKDEFIKKGMDLYRSNKNSMEKFPEDVVIAEKRTDGDENILDDPKFSQKAKAGLNISEIFGTPKLKNSPKPPGRQKSASSSAKKTPARYVTHPRFIGKRNDHIRVVLMQQKKEEAPAQNMTFKCAMCLFTSGRLDAIALHTKTHIKSDPLFNDVRKKVKKRAPKKHKIPTSKTNSIDEDLALLESGLSLSGGELTDAEPEEKKKKRKGRKRTPAAVTPRDEATTVKKAAPNITNDLLAEWDDGDDDDDDADDEDKMQIDAEVDTAPAVPEKPVEAAVVPKTKEIVKETRKVKTPARQTPKAAKNKEKAVKDAVVAKEQENGGKAPAEKLEMDFTALLETTKVPEVPNLPKVKADTVKIGAKSPEVATKLTNPKKRFVKSFEDFELSMKEKQHELEKDIKEKEKELESDEAKSEEVVDKSEKISEKSEKKEAPKKKVDKSEVQVLPVEPEKVVDKKKPIEEKNPIEEKKLIEDKKPIEEKKLTVEKKPIEEKKLTVEKKPIEERVPTRRSTRFDQPEKPKVEPPKEVPSEKLTEVKDGQKSSEVENVINEDKVIPEKKEEIPEERKSTRRSTLRAEKEKLEVKIDSTEKKPVVAAESKEEFTDKEKKVTRRSATRVVEPEKPIETKPEEKKEEPIEEKKPRRSLTRGDKDKDKEKEKIEEKPEVRKSARRSELKPSSSKDEDKKIPNKEEDKLSDKEEDKKSSTKEEDKTLSVKEEDKKLSAKEEDKKAFNKDDDRERKTPLIEDDKNTSLKVDEVKPDSESDTSESSEKLDSLKSLKKKEDAKLHKEPAKDAAKPEEKLKKDNKIKPDDKLSKKEDKPVTVEEPSKASKKDYEKSEKSEKKHEKVKPKEKILFEIDVFGSLRAQENEKYNKKSEDSPRRETRASRSKSHSESSQDKIRDKSKDKLESKGAKRRRDDPIEEPQVNNGKNDETTSPLISKMKNKLMNKLSCEQLPSKTSTPQRSISTDDIEKVSKDKSETKKIDEKKSKKDSEQSCSNEDESIKASVEKKVESIETKTKKDTEEKVKSPVPSRRHSLRGLPVEKEDKDKRLLATKSSDYGDKKFTKLHEKVEKIEEKIPIVAEKKVQKPVEEKKLITKAGLKSPPLPKSVGKSTGGPKTYLRSSRSDKSESSSAKSPLGSPVRAVSPVKVMQPVEVPIPVVEKVEKPDKLNAKEITTKAKRLSVDKPATVVDTVQEDKLMDDEIAKKLSAIEKVESPEREKVVDTEPSSAPYSSDWLKTLSPPAKKLTLAEDLPSPGEPTREHIKPQTIQEPMKEEVKEPAEEVKPIETPVIEEKMVVESAEKEQMETASVPEEKQVMETGVIEKEKEVKISSPVKTPKSPIKAKSPARVTTSPAKPLSPVKTPTSPLVMPSSPTKVQAPFSPTKTQTPFSPTRSQSPATPTKTPVSPTKTQFSPSKSPSRFSPVKERPHTAAPIPLSPTKSQTSSPIKLETPTPSSPIKPQTPTPSSPIKPQTPTTSSPIKSLTVSATKQSPLKSPPIILNKDAPKFDPFALSPRKLSKRDDEQKTASIKSPRRISLTSQEVSITDKVEVTVNRKEGAPATKQIEPPVAKTVEPIAAEPEADPLDLLASVSTFNKDVIEKNVTVVPENILADGQVEIAKIIEDGTEKIASIPPVVSVVPEKEKTEVVEPAPTLPTPEEVLEQIGESDNKLDLVAPVQKPIILNSHLSADQDSTSKLLDILTDNKRPSTTRPTSAVVKPASQVPLPKIATPKFDIEPKKVASAPPPKPVGRILAGPPTSGSAAPSTSKTKPTILSDTLIRPADALVSVQKVKRTYDDIEDIDTFIITKHPKKSPVEEDRVKTASPTVAAKSKPKILEHTIITAAGQVLQPITKKKTIIQQTIKVPSGSSKTVEEKVYDLLNSPKGKEDDTFDIDNMPIVMGDQLLTPDNIEAMPVVMAEQPTKPVQQQVVRKVVQQIKPIPKTPISGSTGIVKTAPSTKTYTKLVKGQRVYQTGSTTGSPTILKHQPTILASGKQGKFVIVPSQSTAPPGTKYTVGKRPVMKKQPAILQTKTAQGVTTAEPSGNKIMIVTNSTGQQQRVLVTPEQQKLIGYQPVKKVIAKNSPAQLKERGKVFTQTATASPGSGLVAVKKPKLDAAKTPGQPQKKFSFQGPLPPLKGAPGQTRTVIIKNQQGQIVNRIHGTSDADIEKQVAEQLEAINRAAHKSKGGQPVKRVIKKTVTSTAMSATAMQNRTLQSPATTATNVVARATVPPLAPITPKKTTPEPTTQTKQVIRQQKTAVTTVGQRVTAAVPAVTKAEIVPKPTEKKDDRAPKQLVIQDAMGNETTIMEGQILALPSETVDGQPQSYMLVTLDESGSLTPLNNEALMSLDPNLNLGGDLSNMVLQIEGQGGGAAETSSVVTTNSQTTTTTTSATTPLKREVAKPVELPPEPKVPETPPVPEIAPQTLLPEEPGTAAQATQGLEQLAEEASTEQIHAITCSINKGDMQQNLIITGDPVATQKFLESLTEGNPDIANLLAHVEGQNILIHTDGQQILINSDVDNQMLMSLNNQLAGDATDESQVFAGQTSAKNQDILAAALADTDVFQQEQTIAAAKMTQSQLSPGYPMAVNNVLETSTVNSPIMTPLEVPSATSKIKESDVLNQMPKNVDLPITITDPNIVQSVSNQQVNLLAADLSASMELPLTIPDVPTTSAGMNSPTTFYSLPTLDDSEKFTSPISMPLLTEDPEDVQPSTTTEKTDLGIATSEGATPQSSEVEDSKAHEGTAEYLLATSDMCTMSNQMSSLSEPPPDMFDFPVESAYGTEKTGFCTTTDPMATEDADITAASLLAGKSPKRALDDLPEDAITSADSKRAKLD